MEKEQFKAYKKRCEKRVDKLRELIFIAYADERHCTENGVIDNLDRRIREEQRRLEKFPEDNE